MSRFANSYFANIIHMFRANAKFRRTYLICISYGYPNTTKLLVAECYTSVNAIPWDAMPYKPCASDVSNVYEDTWPIASDPRKDHTEIPASGLLRWKVCFQQVDIFFSYLIYVHLIYITYLNLYCRSKRGDTGFCPRFKSSFIPLNGFAAVWNMTDRAADPSQGEGGKREIGVVVA